METWSFALERRQGKASRPYAIMSELELAENVRGNRQGRELCSDDHRRSGALLNSRHFDTADFVDWQDPSRPKDALDEFCGSRRRRPVGGKFSKRRCPIRAECQLVAFGEKAK